MMRARLVVMTALSALLVACGTSTSPSPTATATPAGTGTAATSPTPAFTLAKPGFLTVAVYGSYPPWITIESGDKPGGVDGEWMNSFAKDQGLGVQLFQTDFASLILAVQQGKADVGTYLLWKPERAKQVYYTGPFQHSPTVVYTLSSFNYTGPDSLRGKRLGTGSGYFEADTLEKWQSGTVLFPDEVTGNQALLNGQIDAWFADTSALRIEPFLSHKSEVTAHTINVGDFGFPKEQIDTISYNIVACGNDQTLAALHDSGKWAEILKGWDLDPTADDVGTAAPEQGCP
jgi:ABC-type amino acid transport substrate-binding protein